MSKELKRWSIDMVEDSLGGYVKLSNFIDMERDHKAVIEKQTKTLREVQIGLKVVAVGSCDCQTKTPEPMYHMTHCPYRKIVMLEEMIEAVLKEDEK